MDEELNSVIDEGLKDMEEERVKQNEEDREELKSLLAATLIEIMEDKPRGTYKDLTLEEGSSFLESLEKRYPPLKINEDPGFLFWGDLFLMGYEAFTVDFLDKIVKLDPAEIKLFFKGLYDIHIKRVAELAIDELNLMLNIIEDYREGKIEESIKKLEEDTKAYVEMINKNSENTEEGEE